MITNQLLYQLSYTGPESEERPPRPQTKIVTRRLYVIKAALKNEKTEIRSEM